MKKMIYTTLILSILLSLSACQDPGPSPALPSDTTSAVTGKEPPALTEEPTETPTEVPTEPQTEPQTEEPTQAPGEAESQEPQFNLHQAYTDVDAYLKEVWEKQQASSGDVGLNNTTTSPCSVIVPVLKSSSYRFTAMRDYEDRVTYSFMSVDAAQPSHTVRVCVSLRPGTFEEFIGNYAFGGQDNMWTEDGAVYCWNINYNMWAFDIEDDIDGNFLYVEFPVSEEPTPLQTVYDLFDFELRTYSPD